MFLIFRKNLLAESVLEIVTYYKNNFTETGVKGIIDRVVHNGLTMRANAVKLFKASITAAHAGSKHK